MADQTPIEQLKGLGPASAAMLAESGIHSVQQLRDLGPVFVFATVRRSNHRVSLNLLWAMAAGLQDRKWNSLTAAEKQQLLDQLDRLER